MDDNEREKYAQRLDHQAERLKRALVNDDKAEAWHVVGQLETIAHLLRGGADDWRHKRQQGKRWRERMGFGPAAQCREHCGAVRCARERAHTGPHEFIVRD